MRPVTHTGPAGLQADDLARILLDAGDAVFADGHTAAGPSRVMN